MSEACRPDKTDLAILNALQDDLPLVPRPWEAIASRLGIAEPVLLTRMKKLADAGIIRAISPVLESRPLGLHAATLVALRVPEERLEEVAALVSGSPAVSHNFQREHEYSLWFTIAAKDEAEVHAVLDGILHRAGIPASDMLDLPTIRRIKIDVRFSFPPAPEHDHGYD
jgi:DNA-binding Lrp family transcriptional regulator